MSSRPPGCRYFTGTHLKGAISCGCTVSLSPSWVKQIRWPYRKPGGGQKWKVCGEGRGQTWSCMVTLPLYLTLLPELWSSDATVPALQQSHVTATTPQFFLHRGNMCRKSGGAAVKDSVASKQAAVSVTEWMGTRVSRGVISVESGRGEWWVSLSRHLTASNFILSQPLRHL